jgi:hypothetical protein
MSLSRLPHLFGAALARLQQKGPMHFCTGPKWRLT